MSSMDVLLSGKVLTPSHAAATNKDIDSAYDYVDAIIDTADIEPSSTNPGYMWYGWAIREAFLAGMLSERSKESDEKEPMIRPD